MEGGIDIECWWRYCSTGFTKAIIPITCPKTCAEHSLLTAIPHLPGLLWAPGYGDTADYCNLACFTGTASPMWSRHLNWLFKMLKRCLISWYCSLNARRASVNLKANVCFFDDFGNSGLKYAPLSLSCCHYRVLQKKWALSNQVLSHQLHTINLPLCFTLIWLTFVKAENRWLLQAKKVV